MKIIRLILTILFSKLVLFNIGKFKSKPRVNFYSRFTKNTYLGFNTHFNGMIIRGNARVVIGDNLHSGKDCLMINSYHLYDNANAIPYDTDRTIDKEIIIKENVWFGDRVIVLGGVEIGEGAIIQAGAVVVYNIPDFAIAGGNPAKVFKYRNKQTYLELKNNNKIC